MPQVQTSEQPLPSEVQAPSLLQVLQVTYIEFRNETRLLEKAFSAAIAAF